MNDGVAMLLERMKTHPDEFGVRDSKWASLINNHIMHLEKEDRDAINEGMDKIMQQRFTQNVMEELIDPIEESNKAFDKLLADTHKKSRGQTPIAGVTQTV